MRNTGFSCFKKGADFQRPFLAVLPSGRTVFSYTAQWELRASADILPQPCSADHAQTRKLLAALARHPNAGAVLVLSLGCENLTHEQFVAELGEYDEDRVKFLTCQAVEDELAAARPLLEECAAYAGRFRREPVPASELVVGMKCGGSDGLSGITANPTIGRFSDMMGQ
ncbi:MAG: UxaA family hydrolase, partial [Firmicutes bacterium]|nr:UxaA family hydrolase [Bacillota bacterium]